MANTVKYGLRQLGDLTDRVSSLSPQRVRSVIDGYVAAYNRESMEAAGEWVFQTTVAKEIVLLPGGGTLQPLDDDGNPRPTMAAAEYEAAYPIRAAGDAHGGNRVVSRYMTLAELERKMDEVQVKDTDWRIRHMLAAVLDNVAYGWTDRYPSSSGESITGLGAITVNPLANNDSVLYLGRGSGTLAAADHYTAQAAAIDDANNPFPAMRELLQSYPAQSNAGVTAYVASNLVSSIQGLATFYDQPSPYLRYGADVTVANAGMVGFNDAGIGDEVVGVADNVVIVKWGRLPDGYIVTKVNGVPFVGQRNLTEPSMQGLFTEYHDIDGNHWETRWIRYAGFAVRNRVAAAVHYVGNAAYQVPAAYNAPLAV